MPHAPTPAINHDYLDNYLDLAHQESVQAARRDTLHPGKPGTPIH